MVTHTTLNSKPLEISEGGHLMAQNAPQFAGLCGSSASILQGLNGIGPYKRADLPLVL